MKNDEIMKVGQAARYLGVTTGTVRKWQRAGRLACERIGPRGDRRFRRSELDRFRGIAPDPAGRREALYVRVSGRGDQLSSLAAQEAELRASATGTVVAVYSDIGSGLSERRRGLARALRDAERGEYDVLRVTHRDRLARFGTTWIERALAVSGVTLEVIHEADSESELLADFMALVASFSGRLYGGRSAEARRRLLARAAGG